MLCPERLRDGEDQPNTFNKVFSNKVEMKNVSGQSIVFKPPDQSFAYCSTLKQQQRKQEQKEEHHHHRSSNCSVDNF